MPRRPSATTRPTATACSSTPSRSPSPSRRSRRRSRASIATGALLHDIGKLEAYAAAADPCEIDFTDAGKLQGEIALGYYRVRRLIEDLPGFPRELAMAVLHIILSHHGALEHGSPVVPCTREATLVHMIDNLGGRLGSFDRLEKELPDGSRWSAYDRALGGGAYFGSTRAA
jgi:3'-5' exoribonuclease